MKKSQLKKLIREVIKEQISSTDGSGFEFGYRDGGGINYVTPGTDSNPTPYNINRLPNSFKNKFNNKSCGIIAYKRENLKVTLANRGSSNPRWQQLLMDKIQFLSDKIEYMSINGGDMGGNIGIVTPDNVPCWCNPNHNFGQNC